MSGLLDRAKKTVEEAPEKEFEPVEEKIADVVLDDSQSDGINRAMYNIAGSISLVIISALIFYYKNVNWLIFAPAIIISWAVFNAADLLQKTIESKKLIASGIAFLVVSMAATGAAFFIGSGDGPTITTIELDGDDNELRVTIYGSAGSSFDVEVQADGVTTCTKSGSINIDRVTVELDIADCWDGNALDGDADEVIEYRVVVKDGDYEDSYGVNPEFMTRQANVGIVEMLEYMEYEDGDQQGTSKHEGMYVKLWVGHGDPTDAYEITANSSVYGGKIPQPITTDVDVKVEIIFDGSTLKTWDFKVKEGITNGYGEFNRGWVQLPGGGPENTVPRSVYDDDGCYTFKVTLTNEVGDDIIVDQRSKLNLSWNDNDADEDSSNNQDPTVCS